MNNRSKPQTLFKKTSTKNHESLTGSPMFADIPKEVSKQDESPAEGA
jgi:hypothetical protein